LHPLLPLVLYNKSHESISLQTQALPAFLAVQIAAVIRMGRDNWDLR